MMATHLELLAAIRAEVEASRPPSMFDNQVYIELPPAALHEAVRQQISRELGREVQIETGSIEEKTGWYVTTKKPVTPPSPDPITPHSKEAADLIS